MLRVHSTCSLSVEARPGYSILRLLAAVAIFAASAIAQIPTTVTVTCNANPAVYSQPVTVTAAVTTGAAGTVTFAPYGQTVPIVNGQAQVDFAGRWGSIPVTATCHGDANFAPSVSQVYVLQINPAKMSIAVTEPEYGQYSDPNVPLEMTASFGALPPATVGPAGSVDFFG